MYVCAYNMVFVCCVIQPPWQMKWGRIFSILKVVIGHKPHHILDQKVVEQSVLIIFLISAHNFFTIVWKYPHTYIRPYPLCLCKQDINKNEISTNLPIMPSIRIVNSIANTNKQLWTTNLLKISVKMWSIKIVLSSVC